jgi:hypothetical protein
MLICAQYLGLRYVNINKTTYILSYAINKMGLEKFTFSHNVGQNHNKKIADESF